MKLRLDIQKLRTFAVLGVVVYHLWPNALPGGFIGVDVFFVISGFLISSHLFRELEQGKFTFAGFWARRARRILPSATVVLALTTIGIFTISLALDRVKAAKNVLASLLFAENWSLAADSVDYLAKDEAALPTQHYWSLSVEEQFYLFWPVLIFMLWKFAKSRVAVILTILVASYAFSIYATFADPSPAYFSTFTRIWEFCIGALVALFPARLLRKAWVYYLGWLALVYSVFFITADSVFPGYIAMIPVAATALIIWIEHDTKASRPNVFIAEISFALYLWHWPLIVFTKQLKGLPLTDLELTGVLGLSIVLAWLTTKYVEGPIRFGKKLKSYGSRKFLTWSLVSLLVLAGAGTGAWAIAKKQHADAVSDFKSGVSPTALIPDPKLASLDVSKISTGTKCASSGSSDEVRICNFGSDNPTATAAVFGDSHMMALFPAIEQIAISRNWKLTTYVRSACPFIGRHFIKTRDPREAACDSWNDQVREILAKQEPFDFVFVTANHKDGLLGTKAYGMKSFQLAWQPLIDRGTKLIAIRDTPLMVGALECLQRNPAEPAKCALEANDETLGNDSLFEAAKITAGVYPLDLTPTLCPNGQCQIALNGFTVMRDHGHLTTTFAKSLAPIIEIELVRQGALSMEG